MGSITQTSDPNFETFTFINTGGQVRRFPDFRFDINMTSKHHLETTYHYQDFAGQADFLNNVDPAFPSPVPQIFGSQGSDRFAFATALRSQLTSKIVNEARLGLAGGTVLFFGNLAPGDFAPFGGNILDFPLVTDPQTANNNSRRNGPRWEFKDSVSWVKGKHNVSVGGTLVKNSLFSQSSGGVLVPQVRFGVPQTDPVFNVFNAVPTNFRGNARSLYALLTGRVDQVSINGKLDEKTKQYTLDGTAITRNEGWEYGFYGQDSFKFRDNLTINYGLRWEAVLTPRHLNGVYIRPGYENLFGISGVGNLFKPGVIGGAVPTYSPVTKDTKAYDDDMNNFAPNIGIAWSPRFENSLLKRILGDGEQTVFRTGYSISFFTGGNFDFDGVWSGNPGLTSFAGKRADIEFAPGSVLLRNGLPALTAPPSPTFPRPATIGIQMRDFDPHQTTPYVQAWSFGIQRELGRETVLEARYVGNRSVGLYGNINLNEVNIFENGFLQEFINAQKNLAISRANSRGDNFRNAGLVGQVPLPIFEASFGSATSNNFANSGFITNLDRGVAGSAANTLATTLAFQNNRIARGLAPNLFQVNPSNLANSVISTNTGGSTYYNALQVELRRRLSRGLLVQGNYTFARSLETFGTTIRRMNSDKGASPYDIRHAFKLNYVYELPFGAGRGWNYRGPGGIIGKVIEGWETDGIVRWQSGRQFGLSSGRLTVNGTDSGLILVGMTWEELQREVRIRKAPDDATRGTVFWLPKDIVENTQKAFGTIAGTPTGRYLAPPTTPGKLGFYYDLYGPNFFRADLSLVKKTRITERTNIEFRTEFLNAFNNPNFLVGAASNDATGVTVGGLTFGQTDQAYLDTSTTNDPGGRLIQFVLRVNF